MKSHEQQIMANFNHDDFIAEIIRKHSELIDYAKIVDKCGRPVFPRNNPGTQAATKAMEIIQDELLVHPEWFTETVWYDLTHTIEEIADHRGIQVAQAKCRENKANTILYSIASDLLDELVRVCA